MPGENIEIRLATDGENDFRRLARDFGQAARGELQRRLRQHIYQTSIPILNELRAAVMGVHVTSSKGGMGSPPHTTNLRRRVAAALRITVAYAGVRIGAAESQIGPSGAALAKYLDAELPEFRRWRHPVFGGPAWETQFGKPWFFETIRNHQDEFEEACYRAVGDVLRDLSH